MRFLVTAKNIHPVPPEMMSGLFDAMIAWVNKYTQSGKWDASWATLGTPGGGGIANVSSAEELDAMLAEFPLGPFSDYRVDPIVELVPSLERAKQAFQAAMGGGR